MSKIDNSTYTIIGGDDDIKSKKVLRENVSAEFVLGDVFVQFPILQKGHKECVANIQLAAAEMANIKKNHPVVADLTDLQLHAAKMYAESLEKLQKYEALMKHCEESMATYKVEMENLWSQCGLPAEQFPDMTLGMLVKPEPMEEPKGEPVLD